MSALLREWYAIARVVAEAAPSDKFFVVEDSDPRVSFDRRVALGGVSDSRPHRRGVLLIAIVSDGADEDTQALGVSSLAQARTVVEALRDAWPDLLSEDAERIAARG